MPTSATAQNLAAPITASGCWWLRARHEPTGPVVTQVAHAAGLNVTVLGLEAGQELTHVAPGRTCFVVVEGSVELPCFDGDHFLDEGDVLIVPERATHTVRARERRATVLAVLVQDDDGTDTCLEDDGEIA